MNGDRNDERMNDDGSSGAESLRDELDTERDVLIGRVIDGEASPADWDSLRAMAGEDPTVWTDLRRTQRQHELLCAAIGQSISVADGVELDHALSNPAPMVRRLELVGRYGGWAAAACLALLWGLGIEPGDTTGRGQVAGIGPVAVRPAGPDEAFEQYLVAGREAGTVIDEVPDRVVVQATPLEDGRRVEVLYLRQILEREVVDQVYRMTQDETGAERPVPVRIQPSQSPRGVW